MGLSKAQSCLQLGSAKGQSPETPPPHQKLSSRRRRRPPPQHQTEEATNEQSPPDNGNCKDNNHLLLERTSLTLSNGRCMYLPRRDSAPVDLDLYLRSHPELSKKASHIHKTSSQLSLLERTQSSNCITVLQGEVAHASACQGVDVLLSSEATTCHVLAVHSTSSSFGTTQPFASLAHIDSCDHPQDLQAMLEEHIQYHREQQQKYMSLKPLAGCNTTSRGGDDEDDFGFFDVSGTSPPSIAGHGSPSPTDLSQFPSYLHASGGSPPREIASSSPVQQQKAPDNTNDDSLIHVQLHIVGGFDDDKGTSFKLSKQILQQWAHLADIYNEEVKIELVTAAISSLNTCQHTKSPMARGLGISIATGQVFGIAESLPSQLEGPALEVRNARAWARACSHTSTSPPTSGLTVIHDRHTEPNTIIIEPFPFSKLPQLDPLLQVPDPVLKEITSTSPAFESDRFCSDIRRTVSFLNRVPSSSVFGDCGSQPLVYTRTRGNSVHEWERKFAWSRIHVMYGWHALNFELLKTSSKLHLLFGYPLYIIRVLYLVLSYDMKLAGRHQSNPDVSLSNPSKL